MVIIILLYFLIYVYSLLYNEKELYLHPIILDLQNYVEMLMHKKLIFLFYMRNGGLFILLEFGLRFILIKV
jgi:hypothetical protein